VKRVRTGCGASSAVRAVGVQANSIMRLSSGTPAARVGRDRPEEHLHTYGDLVDWAEYAGLLDSATAAHRAGTAPTVAKAALHTAIELREAIFHVFAAIGRGDPAPAHALAIVQARYADAMVAARLVPAGIGFDWQYREDAPDRVWWPVAVSAVRLLTAGPPAERRRSGALTLVPLPDQPGAPRCRSSGRPSGSAAGPAASEHSSRCTSRSPSRSK
jgi:predicted RNA-binding Zn ribbon-like protein